MEKRASPLLHGITRQPTTSLSKYVDSAVGPEPYTSAECNVFTKAIRLKSPLTCAEFYKEDSNSRMRILTICLRGSPCSFITHLVYCTVCFRAWFMSSS